MKKDVFYGKIRREYISYIMTTTIAITTILVAAGALFLYAAFVASAVDPLQDRIVLGALGAVCFLPAAAFVFIRLFAIKKYPKYEKLRRLVFNSDCYFVGSNSQDYHGSWRGEKAFEWVTRAAERNKGLENIEYPKKYRVYIVLTIIGVILLFANLGVAYIALKNIDALPELIQNESAVFTILLLSEILDVILSFVFAFRVQKIRIKTKEEYREKQAKDKIEN